MGQKSKNAGKKKSKICDKLATAKSVSSSVKLKKIKMETIYTLEGGEKKEIIQGHPSYTRKLDGRGCKVNLGKIKTT